ncbi:MAG: hypothetical protein ACYDAR_08355 [Thermomicrobiales bacterium]
MTEMQRAGGQTQGTADTRRAMNRRGLIAGAAALAGAALAKQAAQPVVAGVDGDVILGMPNSTGSDTTITNTVTTAGHALVLHCDAANYGLGLEATGTGYGVYGHTSPPVSATSQNFAGVFGDTSGDTSAGVSGLARSSLGGIGVSGNCDAAIGVGVQGTSDKGTGVLGQTTSTGIYGVYGKSAAPGGCGVRGDCTGGYGVLGSVSDGYAVFGQANTGNGVRGFSQQNHAIVGQTARPYYGGVFGAATLPNTVGIYGSTVSNGANVTSAFAGYMDGNFVAVHGVKSAAVPTGGGGYGLVYSMESPECWFEDFGEAKLVGGKAVVTIDPAFAAIVHTDAYHVFLTPRGDCKGLYTSAQTATGFSVREQQGGTSSLLFSYRIVAKRKDVAAARLAKFDLPGKAKHDTKPPRTPDPPKLPNLPKKP